METGIQRAGRDGGLIPIASNEWSAMTQIRADSDIQTRFSRLKGEWKEKSWFLSNSAPMAMLRPYERIIGIGPPAVHLILEELRREPDQWFWALEAITGENPVAPEDAGNISAMADAWIRWGARYGRMPFGGSQHF